MTGLNVAHAHWHCNIITGTTILIFFREEGGKEGEKRREIGEGGRGFGKQNTNRNMDAPWPP